MWNFRGFGSDSELYPQKQLRSPDLQVNFTKGLNVLIGENDTGKTAIIDAIKLVLKTHSIDWIRLEDEDFFNDTSQLRLECRFDDLSHDEAKNFTEWLGIEGENENVHTYLKVILEAQRDANRILPFDIRAGADDVGYPLTAEAKEYLQTAYLKPLRDAKAELVPKRNSRLSKILQGHQLFKDKSSTHKLQDISRCFNCLLQKYFNFKFKNTSCKETLCPFTQKFYSDASVAPAATLKTNLDNHLKEFFGENKDASFGVPEQTLKDILETLNLSLEDGKLGLGSHNLLFIASELINLERTHWTGIRLGLIEELEAHLHPQAQLRVIDSLQNNMHVQFILTTHSPNLASKVNLKHLILCATDTNRNPNVFPMGYTNPEADDKSKVPYTKLAPGDYIFLDRFLDVTKANLFFAKGVILVEGWAEEFFLPALAKHIGINLTEKGISIVNVGGTAFLRYAKIFQRHSPPYLDIPVAVITDVDVKPTDEANNLQPKITAKQKQYASQLVQAFVSPHWTFEYCLSKSSSLGGEFQEIAKQIHSNTNFDDFDQALFTMLASKKLNKVEISYRLAQYLDEQLVNGLSNSPIDETDPYLKYLVDAIKYVARTN